MSGRRLFRPSAWPIAVKLSIALLFAALLPMSVTAAYNLWQSLRSVEAIEYRNLELLAVSTANRLDQLITDTAQVAAQVAGDAEVAQFIAARPEGRAALKASVQGTIEGVVLSDPDVFSVFLLDDRGRCVASTNAENEGQSYAFRDYFQGALEGRPFVSELLTGSTTRRPGVYFSHPVKDREGRTIGVAVLKLVGETIWATVNALRVGEGGHAFLIDRYGVIISHPDKDHLYKSLAPIPAEILSQPSFQQRFSSVGVVTIESLGLAELARVIVAPSAPGHTSHHPGGARQMIGFAPLHSQAWTLAVEEPAQEFEAPLARLARQATLSVILVGALVAVGALLLARSIVRPIRRLTAASRAVAGGDFDAAVIVRSEDEIGALAGAFNTMAAGLKERERERDVFGRVVSPEVREKLLGGDLRLGGETLQVAVLFSDIRGFSSLSERMDPQAVVALLNEYLTEMAAAVRPLHGYINNFIGDAIVVVFGAPIARPDAERRAVAAALSMRQRLRALNERRALRGEARIDTGIGISAGEVVAGQIGSPDRMLYTVIGDAVNVAARLESLTKEYPGHPILVTRAVADALGSMEGSTVTDLGPIKVKGRILPVDVCAVDADLDHPSIKSSKSPSPPAVNTTPKTPISST